MKCVTKMIALTMITNNRAFDDGASDHLNIVVLVCPHIYFFAQGF